MQNQSNRLGSSCFLLWKSLTQTKFTSVVGEEKPPKILNGTELLLLKIFLLIILYEELANHFAVLDVEDLGQYKFLYDQ